MLTTTLRGSVNREILLRNLQKEILGLECPVKWIYKLLFVIFIALLTVANTQTLLFPTENNIQYFHLEQVG